MRTHSALRMPILVIGFVAMCASVAHAQVFQEQGGLLVIQVESVPPTGDWVKETTIGGYTGSGYYRWNGPLLLFDQSKGVVAYQINITNAGKYNFRLRSHHPPGDRGNDCWAKMDNGGWKKAYANAAVANQWVWYTQFDLGATHPDASYDLSAGRHTFYIAGRATDFSIDRIHFYKDGVNGKSTASPESPTSDPVTPPPVTPPADLEVESFALIDADADKIIAAHTPLNSGATLTLGSLPQLNIEAKIKGAVGSVRFVLNGADEGVENGAPYALFGDNGAGDFTEWTPSAGIFTLKATPYAGSGGSGEAGKALTITFTVAAAPPQPDQGVAPPPNQGSESAPDLGVPGVDAGAAVGPEPDAGGAFDDAGRNNLSGGLERELGGGCTLAGEVGVAPGSPLGLLLLAVALRRRRRRSA